MTNESIEILETMDTLAIAASCEALFDQYDEPQQFAQADNDDFYENLYPSLG